jgi:hypothetical protein
MAFGTKRLKKSTGRKKSEADKLITIRGLIMPADWDEEGNINAVAISTFEEDQYLVLNDEKGEQLLPLVRQEVKITGELGQKGSRKAIKPKTFSLK